MQTYAQPAAYIRRSVASRGDPGDTSREFQTETVRKLANGDGPTLRIIDQDWGRSAATDKTGARTAFLALLDDIEAGSVSHVYAYSPDRLARSVEWSARLVNVCRRASVPITTTAGTVAPDDPAARAMFNMLAVMNENALDEMERKAQASIDRRKARNGEAGLKENAGMGRPNYGTQPGESVQAILDAFQEAGSFLGTCKLLNERGVKTRLGRPWDVHTVSRIIRRTAPALVPLRPRQGQRSRATRTFAGLLVCSCGDTLTSMPRAGSVGYYCRRAHLDLAHSRPYVVSERKLLPLAEAEAALLRTPEVVQLAEQNTQERARLDARRTEVLNMAEVGDITREERQDRLARIHAEVQRLDERERVVAVPSIDFGWEPDVLNAALRALWVRIELGPDMMPVRFEWSVPEWRRPHLAGV